MTDEDPNADAAPSERLASINNMLAEWAAASADESPALIERFEAMGYRVRGKSREEITEVLKHPPSGPPA
ncbi:hypothetical protein [Methylobacterium sp. Leaf88]|uniref:hypothetical protein n=1 Tax=Methylobacterium sp. Leaf88 TaxID=1736244 RepID=UPI0009E7EDD5|nr:hypothetical protein [Methylobacterium sp. Leaf88]